MSENQLGELKPAQIDEVKKKVIELFGEEMVKEVDRVFLMLQAKRLGSKDPYDFLKRVADEDPEYKEKLVGALLYGMKLGEESAALILGRKHEAEIKELKDKQQEPQDGAVIAPHVDFVPEMYM
jgi:hypothetical protein